MIDADTMPPSLPRDRLPAESTAEIRARSITSAIVAMRENLGEPQELTDAARAALMSPFHFHRVFRMMTAATPGRFLTAMRMAEAKRLLLETDLSATEISITVGYSSFGTFTSQFNRLVGMPPGRFRTCAAPLADVPVRLLLDQLPQAEDDGRGPCGWLSSRPDHSPGIAVVGLFPSAIAQEIPKSCAVIEPPGRVALPPVARRGAYAALAVSVEASATVFEVLTESAAAGLYVGAAPEPIEIRGPGMPMPTDFFIALREPRITDPSVLTAFPLLAAGGGPPRSGRRAT
ncbi:AraC family transcriptional regulator [Sphaerisporangium sp. TRM90804]|uniref:AraC family transcriptional regulator n=1 Tax=Sphaerisporangium sp. TRM90804 TaxID=3031113 RepID=UPI002447DE65|nr:AraC family transcriptional regulator [Sphaerisporangium sp. TRM90804]MDH2429617.1 AraC family transcriptional regulator [Sphaerisporangium sp. TRM90804]